MVGIAKLPGGGMDPVLGEHPQHHHLHSQQQQQQQKRQVSSPFVLEGKGKSSSSSSGGSSKSKLARRRRIEIRRFKLIAEEPLPKRARITSTTFLLAGDEQQQQAAAQKPIQAATFSLAGDEKSQRQRQQQQPEQASASIELPDSSGKDRSRLSCMAMAAKDKCPPYGVVAICGRRREMEDTVAVVPCFATVPCKTICECDCEDDNYQMSNLHFFGVYDGHGGVQVATSCKDYLHRILAEELSSGSSDKLGTELERALPVSFRRMDAQVGGFCYKTDHPTSAPPLQPAIPPAPETVGSTAVVTIVGSKQIVVANVGDSRAVLSRGGQAIPLSKDHKPNSEDELARIEAAGGRVIFWNGYRVLGVLAMSRAIGDRYLKPSIIPDPDVTCVDRSPEDECLVLASDGLWDVLSNELVCEIARRCLHKGSESKRGESAASAAAALLAKVAFAKGSGDNISIVVVDLRVSR